MLEILQFVFSSFWVWLGTVVLLMTIGATICAAVCFRDVTIRNEK